MTARDIHLLLIRELARLMPDQQIAVALARVREDVQQNGL
jgi:hypothetical protein